MIVEIRDEVATLRGDLTRNQEDALVSALMAGLRHYPAGMVLDLAELGYAKAEGARSLQSAAAAVGTHLPAARLILVNAAPGVGRVLRASGIPGGSIGLAPTLTEARERLKQPPATASAAGGSATGNFPPAIGDRHPIVIAGVLGSDADEHAVAVACRLAATIPSHPETGDPVARMHLARVLIVPRDRSLLAPVDAEEVAVKRLTQFAYAVEEGGCVAAVVTQIERTRDGGLCLAELAGELRASFLVLALGSNASSEDVTMARYVVERAPCEVIVNRVRLSELQGGNDADTSGKEQNHGH